MRFLLFSLCLWSGSLCYAVEQQEEPPKSGNLALPVSQQPTPLVSFGEKGIDQGQVQLYFYADDFQGKKKEAYDTIPSVLYGITDNLSLFLGAPYTPKLKNGSDHSKGWEDCLLQCEYAYYNGKSAVAIDQATVVVNMTFPTGSSKKNPPTGYGAKSFFLGGTYNHMTPEWFAFTSHGVVVPTADHGTRFGDQFLYQFGYGRNISSPKEWIYAWMFELDGEYSVRNKIEGSKDPNSGGNVLFLTPSLWASSTHFTTQFGVGVPIIQHLFGSQRKYHYSLILNIGYTF